MADSAVSVYAKGHTNAGVAAVIDVLCAFYHALEDGTVADWQPDPSYQRSRGRDPWTEDEVDRIIAGLDEEYGKELRSWASKPRWSQSNGLGCDAGPDFARLQPPQRLALVQVLDQVLQEHAEALSNYAKRIMRQVTVNGWSVTLHQHLLNGRIVATSIALEHDLWFDSVDEAIAALTPILEAKEAPKYPAWVADPYPYDYYD